MSDHPHPPDPDQPTRPIAYEPATTPLSRAPSDPDDSTDPLDQAAQQVVAVPERAGEHLSSTSKYTRHEEIGRGGMGRVSLAFDHNLQRHVAIKEVLPTHRSPEMNERFLREAYLTGELEHPGTVPVYAFGALDDGSMFYAMRQIVGVPLSKAISALPPVRPFWGRAERRALIQRFLQACQAVAFAHSRNIVHRDIKPGNIMIGDFGETIVLDWGSAKRMGESEPELTPEEAESASIPSRSGSSYNSPATRAGAIIGTPAYMAPEQARAQHDRVGFPADVFSLGATLYEIATGVNPYGHREQHVLEAAIQADYRPPRRLSPGLPPELETIILKAMAPDPGQRYANAGVLAHELEQFLTGARVESHRYSRYALVKRWLRVRRALVTTVLLIFVAIVGMGAGVGALDLGRSLGLALIWAVDAQLESSASLIDEFLEPADGALSLAEQIAYREGTDTSEAEVALATAAASFPHISRLQYAHGVGEGAPVLASSDRASGRSASADAREQPWHSAALNEGSAIALTGPFVDVNTGEPTLTLSRLIPSIAAGRETVVAADLRLRPLAEMLKPHNFPTGGAVLVAKTQNGTAALPWEGAEALVVGSTLPIGVFDPSHEGAGRWLVKILHRSTVQGQGQGIDFLRDIPLQSEGTDYAVEHAILVRVSSQYFVVFSAMLDSVPWTVSLFMPVDTFAKPFRDGGSTFARVVSVGSLIAVTGITLVLIFQRRRGRHLGAHMAGDSGSISSSSSWPSST